MISKHEPHPKGLWVLSLIYIAYTITFGGINAILILYLREKLNLSPDAAYTLFATYMSLIFTLPLVGGYLSEKFGYKYAITIGLCLAVIGAAVLSMPYTMAMYVGLAIFVIGNGYSTPAAFTTVGLLYAKQGVRRESGYTLFYLLFNIGFAFSFTLGGYAVRYIGFNNTFLLVSGILLFAVLMLGFAFKYIQPYPGRSIEPQVSYSPFMIVMSLLLIALVGVPLCIILLEKVFLNSLLQWGLAFFAIAAVITLAYKQKEALAKYKLLAFILLSIISTTFWSLYMLEPSLLTVFISSNVDRQLGSYNIPAASFFGLDPIYIVTLGLFFSWLWGYLGRRHKDLALPTKFALSLLIMGGGYLIFALGISLAGADHLTHMSWIVLGYLLLSVAELLISPIGLAMVDRLSPSGKEGAMMGVWQLFTGIAAVISGYLANMAAVPKTGTPVMTNPIYQNLFFKIGLGGIVIGIITVLLIPAIKKLITTES